MIDFWQVRAYKKLLEAIKKQAEEDKQKGYYDKYYGKLEENSIKEWEESLAKNMLDYFPNELLENHSEYEIDRIIPNKSLEQEFGFDEDDIIFFKRFIIGKGKFNIKKYLERKRKAKERGKELCLIEKK